MLYSDRIQRLPVIRFSTLSASILSSLLGLTLPASAQQIAWSPAPPPISRSQLANPGDLPPALPNKDPQAENLPSGERAEDGVQTRPEVSGQNAGAKKVTRPQEENTSSAKTDAGGGSAKNMSTDSTIDENVKKIPGYNLQSTPKDLVTRFVQWRWIPYLIAALIFILLVWLSILTRLAYLGLAEANRKNNNLRKQFSEIQIVLESLAAEFKIQKTAQFQTQKLANETISKMAGYASTLSILQADLTAHKNRLLDIQTAPHLHTILEHKSVLLEEYERDQPAFDSDPQSIHDPATSLTNEYQEAFFRGDRSALRRMMPDELNITQLSEDALMKTASLPTQLEIVKTGGSYLLIHREGKHFLVPDFQILTSFTTNQLAKGIFSYQRENVSTAELRRPAEVRDVGCLWEVVTMGVIAVPT